MPTEKALDRAVITCNKNAVPFDTEKPAITSGIRLGSPAGTTRGFGPAEFREIGKLIVEVVDAVAQERRRGRSGSRSKRARRVAESVPPLSDLPIDEKSDSCAARSADMTTAR